MLFLALIFAAVGMASTVIGLGGGTAYLIFMELFRVPPSIIPVVALSSNIIVSGTGASIRLLKKESCSLRLLATILLPSMSLAYLGASLRFQEQFYRLMLNALILLIILVRIVLQYKLDSEAAQRREQPTIKTPLLMGISGAVGFSSGLVGIGGGIILGPVLYLSGMSYKKIPLITALYIFLNSIVGISARLQSLEHLSELKPYGILPVISAVSSILTMLFVTYRVGSKQIKIIVMFTIGVLSLYNMGRLVVLYG